MELSQVTNPETSMMTQRSFSLSVQILCVVCCVRAHYNNFVCCVFYVSMVSCSVQVITNCEFGTVIQIYVETFIMDMSFTFREYEALLYLYCVVISDFLWPCEQMKQVANMLGVVLKMPVASKSLDSVRNRNIHNGYEIHYIQGVLSTVIYLLHYNCRSFVTLQTNEASGWQC